jgi:hypothetical protein
MVGEGDAVPRLVLRGDGTLRRILVAWRRLLVQEPRGVHAAVGGFVAEGRRFAETEEGQEWLEALSRSQRVRRGRVLWDLYASRPDEREPDITPSEWLSALLEALVSPELEREAPDDPAAVGPA